MKGIFFFPSLNCRPSMGSIEAKVIWDLPLFSKGYNIVQFINERVSCNQESSWWWWSLLLFGYMMMIIVGDEFFVWYDRLVGWFVDCSASHSLSHPYDWAGLVSRIGCVVHCAGQLRQHVGCKCWPYKYGDELFQSFSWVWTIVEFKL